MLREKAMGNIVSYSFIREWISHWNKGGIKFPKSDIPHTIKDLVDLGLIKKVSRLKFQLLTNKDKRLKPDIL